MKKALIAVKMICEKGNKVCFGPGPEHNYVLNATTNKKVMLGLSGNRSYLLDGKYKGSKEVSIVVDSGAEENVCPYGWDQEFGMTNPSVWLDFSGANGANIDHYGQRTLIMEATS